MAINLSALSALTSQAISLSNLILVSPQVDKGISPQISSSSNNSPETFLFNFNGEQKVTLTTDVTDHYTEDNTPIQDNAALKPDLISGSGYIGELTDFTNDAPPELKTLQEKLTVLATYTPSLSVSALVTYNRAFQAYQVAQLIKGSAVSSWGGLSGSAARGDQVENAIFPAVQNKQQVAFYKFYGWQKQRTLFTVQTPWAIFKNMIIISCTSIQDADTAVVTDFELTFKPIRYASTKILLVDSLAGVQGNGQGRQNNLRAENVDHGTSKPSYTDDLAAKVSVF